MLNLLTLYQGRLRQINAEKIDDLSAHKLIWVDVVEPTAQDAKWVAQHCNITLPDLEELENLESSARFFTSENDELHLRSDFLIDDDEHSKNIGVAFVIANNILFSVHDRDLPVFRLVRLRGRIRTNSINDCFDVLLDLYATDAEYSADTLEEVYRNLSEVSDRVLLGSKNITDDQGSNILESIAIQENINGYVRRNMMDTRRAVSFLMRGRLLKNKQREEARAILLDIDSIYGHTAFLFDKINFLMDAVVSFLSVNQNRIIKIFSVASVAMLPPTLVASIYGMNFGAGMPELGWGGWGYAFALGLMALSIAIPLWYFRKRGWLR